MPETDGPLRYRGLRFPRDGAVLSAAVADALSARQWQSAYTDAVFDLAQTDDRVAVLGAGVGHVPALLAGKLGVRHVFVLEDNAARRQYLAQVASANGLFRMSIRAPEALPPLRPTLLFADLSTFDHRPYLEACTDLRAAAVYSPNRGHETGNDPVIRGLASLGLRGTPSSADGDTTIFART